jgi:hypothetical protein
MKKRIKLSCCTILCVFILLFWCVFNKISKYFPLCSSHIVVIFACTDHGGIPIVRAIYWCPTTAISKAIPPRGGVSQLNRSACDVVHTLARSRPLRPIREHFMVKWENFIKIGLETRLNVTFSRYY